MPAQGGATDAAPSNSTVRDMSNGIRNQDKKGKKSWFKLASFNVRGLTKRIKQEQLSLDMKKYGVDVVLEVCGMSRYRQISGAPWFF